MHELQALVTSGPPMLTALVPLHLDAAQPTQLYPRSGRGVLSVVRMARVAREGNDVTNIVCTSHKLHKPLEAKAKASMWHRTIPA